jgi:hypothetical protein
MGLPPEQDCRDKTEKAFRAVAEWKRVRVKGKITLHFDGSGFCVKAIEEKEL